MSNTHNGYNSNYIDNYDSNNDCDKSNDCDFNYNQSIDEDLKDNITNILNRIRHTNGVLSPNRATVDIPILFLRNKKYTIYEKILYQYLLTYSTNHGDAYPSLERMQLELGLSRPTLIKHLKSLEEKNGVLILNRINKETNEKDTNLYYLGEIIYKTGDFNKSYLDLVKMIFPNKKIFI